MIVFFSSCNSVKFHSELLNYVDLPVLDLHGDQKQNKRTATFFEFVSAEKGILLSTDVAARGLDIPAVDWIVQARAISSTQMSSALSRSGRCHRLHVDSCRCHLPSHAPPGWISAV